MENLKQNVLHKWLEIDFFYIAKQMRLINFSIEADEKLIYDTIRCLDYESIVSKTPSINYIITVVGLMWEHADHEKYDMRHVIIKFLSRIGYPTSAIICDKNFDKEECSFSKIGSWVDEVTSTLNQIDNEIVIAGKKYLLTDFQKQIWNSMDEDKILGISAPTSAGKSFVILLKLVNRLVKENIDIVYIVPTLSLLNQVTEDFNRELKNVGVTDYWITNSFDEGQQEKYNQNKAIRLLGFLPFENVNVDELEQILKEIFRNNPNYIAMAKIADKSNLRKLIRIYDFLKYKK